MGHASKPGFRPAGNDAIVGSHATSLRAPLIALAILGALIRVSLGGVHAQDAGDDDTSLPEAAPPEIGDPPSDAELQDLQAVTDRDGISIQEPIDQYAWRDNFALATSRIRVAAPEDFAAAEIVDAGSRVDCFRATAFCSSTSE